MEHLVAGVLRELQIKIVVPEANNLPASIDKSSREFRAFLSGAATTNNAHQQRGLSLFSLAVAPNAGSPSSRIATVSLLTLEFISVE
jgi:hypothetical protein